MNVPKHSYGYAVINQVVEVGKNLWQLLLTM